MCTAPAHSRSLWRLQFVRQMFALEETQVYAWNTSLKTKSYRYLNLNIWLAERYEGVIVMRQVFLLLTTTTQQISHTVNNNIYNMTAPRLVYSRLQVDSQLNHVNYFLCDYPTRYLLPSQENTIERKTSLKSRQRLICREWYLSFHTHQRNLCR